MRVYPEEGLTMVKVSEKPKNKFYAFMEMKAIALALLLLIVIMALVDYAPDFVIKGLFLIVLLILLFRMFYVKIGNFFRSENIEYNTIGKIHFRDDCIEVNNEKRLLSEINRIDISNYDFVDKYIPSQDNPMHSLGISNFITITYKDNSVETIQFMQENENHLMWFRNELMHYHNLQLIDIATIKRVLK
ncbi:hypothetical protein H1R17_01705 [Flavobacterium sp. xlx-214]|uniref:hypothetical protein n=1 Tax=unclassified Flavobacterium TaxID=196869 RepID=UPI0013D2E41F|nr:MULTISPECIES: hypothetical protein [unclassified Flavobacterium]MBA5792737.1 hypothetical protein [Flavobacterium sp. xlx-221]QMI83874.1 hypothetical protein H1R17_01705 [Flavobacterium sp. xlx-214]